MEKKENNIAKNTSSGADKVEKISDTVQEKAENAGDAVKKTVSRTVKTASDGINKTEKKVSARLKEPKSNEKKSQKSKKETKEQKERAAAQRRVDAALAREERKAKRAELKELRKAKHNEKKLEMKAKRQEHAAKMQEKRAERKAERIARKELLRNETAAQRIARIEKERAEKLALKKLKREQAYHLKLEKRDARLKKREEKLRDKQHRRETRRTPGFGGWLAAVISLGVVSLALTAVVTLGAINMSNANSLTADSYRGTMYELAEILENMDEDLSKARVSATPTQQSRLFTDLLVQARLAESSLERIPVDEHIDTNMTSFINRTADESLTLLNKLRAGGSLTDEDAARIEKLYETNRKVKEEVARLSEELTEKDMMAFMKAKEGNRVLESFQTMENLTLEENKTEEGPFSEIAAEQSASGEQAAAEEISSSRAEELCREYFKDYAVSSADYAGETISRNIQTYNFFLRDDQGRQIFAQIAKKGGALVEFDFYENCTEKNFDLARAKTIAEEYLEGLGYENMTAVWVNESGTLATFNFAYEEDGTVYYPDLVKVKVCESKGKVVGLDAVAFLKNHRSRVETNAKITLADAQSKLNKNVQVESSRLTVIPVENEEIAAYEFLCAYGDESYFIYINAVTGEEERILRVADSAQGRVLQ